MDLVIRPYQETDQAAVIDLWRRCELLHPRNDPQRDIALKVADSGALFLVGELDGQVVAVVMAGYEGHRGQINYLGVDPACRRRGLGRALMAAAEARLRALGCPKINLHVRTSNLGVIEFYRALGFEVDECVCMGKRLG